MTSIKSAARHFHGVPRRLRFVAIALLLAFLAAAAHAQTTNRASQVRVGSNDVDRAYIREHYTKYEYKIPMRDGVKLFAAVYAPKDNSQPYPMLMTRTPYSAKPYSEDLDPDPNGPMLHYGKEKFIFVIEDVRGRNGSEGEFVHMRPQKDVKSGPRDIDESTD